MVELHKVFNNDPIFVFLLPILVKGWSNGSEEKIVGGQDASPGQFPYQAAILFNGAEWCGGSIISFRSILTAAHCFFFRNEPLSKQNFTVRVGSLYYNAGGQLFETSRVILHEGYNGMDKTKQNDIAVLQVRGVFHLSGYVGIVRLPFQNAADPADGSVTTIAGWGKTGDASHSTALKYVEVPIVNRDHCNTRYPGITKNNICAGYANGGKDSCQGDSGGPLVLKSNVQVGVTSFGKGCAEADYPGVYTTVSQYINWISRYF